MGDRGTPDRLSPTAPMFAGRRTAPESVGPRPTHATGEAVTDRAGQSGAGGRERNRNPATNDPHTTTGRATG